MVRDAVATADGQMQISLGISQSLGSAQESTSVLAVGLHGRTRYSDSIFILHRGSADPSARGRVGLLMAGPLPVGVTRYARDPAASRTGLALMVGASHASIVVSGLLRNPYKSLLPSANYYARPTDGRVVTQV